MGRALQERDTKYKHTEKRLGRNIARENFDKELSESFFRDKRKFFRKGVKYAILNLTDIQKKYAINMENLDRVRDGDEGGGGKDDVSGVNDSLLFHL